MPLVNIGVLTRLFTGRQADRLGHENAQEPIAIRGIELLRTANARSEEFEDGNRKNLTRFFGTPKMQDCQAPANDVVFNHASWTAPYVAHRVSFLIREARSEDAGAIDRLLRHLDSIHAETRPGFCYPGSTRPRGDCFLEIALSDDRQKIYVAVVHGDVKAFVHLSIRTAFAGFGLRDRRYAKITSLAVDPHYQRNGIAWRLMGSAFTWASSNGISDHEITVDELNAPAMSLCKRTGFRPHTATLRRTADY
jgi:GNAT superfamily N-acetyltransferase